MSAARERGAETRRTKCEIKAKQSDIIDASGPRDRRVRESPSRGPSPAAATRCESYFFGETHKRKSHRNLFRIRVRRNAVSSSAERFPITGRVTQSPQRERPNRPCVNYAAHYHCVPSHKIITRNTLIPPNAAPTQLIAF